MKRQINLQDIVITDKIIKDDHRNAGYNIGDLLNMPYLHNIWNNCPHADNNILERAILLSKHYPDSILNYYYSSRNNEESIPNINRIINSVEKFKKNNISQLNNIISIVKDPKCCCVHVRNGDVITENNFIKTIIYLSYKFDKIILLSGIHMDNLCKNDNAKKINFLNTMNSILMHKNNIYIYIENPDIHISIMSEASNLLLHKGGFSCLGSIVSTGNLFVTDYFTYIHNANWLSHVNKKYTKII